MRGVGFPAKEAHGVIRVPQFRPDRLAQIAHLQRQIPVGAAVGESEIFKYPNVIVDQAQ